MLKFTIRKCFATAALLASPMSILPLYASDVPDAIAAHGETLVATVEAAGAQIYECKTDMSGKLAWQFREPVATLFAEGKTVGRHYAGPHWEMTDGSIVSARVSARAPGASENDIPLLKLEVESWRGAGQLSGITTIQRINTRGGVAEGPCEVNGTLLSVPYAADYTFYRKTAVALPPVPSAPRPVVVRHVPVATPVFVAPRPAIGVIVVRGDDRDRRPRKKRGEPKSPPTQPTPPTAEPKSPPIVPNRTVRDHRGTTGSGPTVTPTRPTYDGAEKAERSGPSEKRQPKMRDHRGVDAGSRDGASGKRQPKMRDHRGATTPPKTGNPPRGSASSGSGGINCRTQGNPRCQAN